MAKPVRPVVVYVVDDDDDVRDAFDCLLRSVGIDARPYASAESFLGQVEDQPKACVLLDIALAQWSGTQVQSELNRRRIALPVIAVSASDDEDVRRLAQDLGARMFLRKPVDDQALLDAIHWVTQPPSGSIR